MGDSDRYAHTKHTTRTVGNLANCNSMRHFTIQTAKCCQCERYWVHTEQWDNEYLELETVRCNWRGARHDKVITVLELPVAHATKGYWSIWERKNLYRIVIEHNSLWSPPNCHTDMRRVAAETSNKTLNRYLTAHYKQECANVCLLFIQFHIGAPISTALGFGWL